MQAHHNEKNERISLSHTQYCTLLVNLFVALQQIVRSFYVGCNQITKFASNFSKPGGLAMNREFHDKRQSLTVTNKHAGVGKLFN